MVTLLITALAILTVIGIAIYFWQKPSPDRTEYTLPPAPDAKSLFSDDQSFAQAEAQRLAKAASENDESLIARAREGNRAALNEAHASGDADLYNRVLNELVSSAQSEAKLLALMSHVTRDELPVNRALAQAVIAAWKQSPARESTSKALHFAALSDSPDLYREAVERALQLWREGKIANVSAVELGALFDGEFWVLSSRSRSSGAGFVLKRSLASARRELKSTGARSPRVSKGDHSKAGPP